MTIITLTNQYYGIAAEVCGIGGEVYRVILKDIEANEILPTIKIFRSLEKALKYAEKLVA